MKSYLKILFVAFFIVQAVFVLNLEAENGDKIDLNPIFACKDCK